MTFFKSFISVNDKTTVRDTVNSMKRAIKSYVLRAGRLSPRQERGLQVWLANYLLPSEEMVWDIPAIFGREADTIVEIGFGMGASLLVMARDNPDINFIGIEVHRAGIGSLAADLHDAGLTNVRIAPVDAVAVFQHQIKRDSLAGIQIFFPDPWPKARHHKRRLIQTEFIKQLVVALKPGGFIHCATDWENYAEHMLAVLSAEPALCNQSIQPDGFSPRPARRPLTKFEHRGQLLGHGVWDLIFCK